MGNRPVKEDSYIFYVLKITTPGIHTHRIKKIRVHLYTGVPLKF